MNWKPKTVSLIDGKKVLSDSEGWRAECEARYVLNLPSIDARRALLAAIEKRRGKPAREDLEKRVIAVWQMNKKRP